MAAVPGDDLKTLTASLSGGSLGDQLGGFLNGGHWPPLKRAVSRGIRDSLAIIQRVHKTEVVGRGIGPWGGVWSTRTGEALRSFHIAMAPDALEGAYGSELTRIGVLEMGTQEALGGPLRPKHGKYLAIPTQNAKRGKGRGLAPRDTPGLVFITSKAGNPLLIRPKGRGQFDVMFLLRTQVTIPPHPTMERAVSRAQPAVDARLLKAVEEGLQPKGLK